MNLTKHKRQAAKLAGNVTRANAMGNRNLLRSAIRDYLNSYSCRLIATKKAMDTTTRRSHKSVEEIASEMNVWNSCDEVAKVNAALIQVPPDRGQAGDYDIRARVTVAFGVENQARQILIRELLKAMWTTSPAQTMMNGGRTRAVKLIKEYYADGFQYIAEVDIQRCFQSFNKQGISKYLCLPEKVTENVLGASSLNLHPSLSCKKEALYHSPDMSCSPMELFMNKYGKDWDPTRLGLIEGSRASPFVAELLLAPICIDLAERGAGRVVNYADNFLLMARSNSELRNQINVLREGLHGHPAGPLQVKEKLVATAPGSSFEFLGYQFSPDGKDLVCKWAKKSILKAREMRRIGHKKLTSNMPQSKKMLIFEELENRHRSLIGSFPEWSTGRKFHQDKMAQLRAHFDN